MDTAANGLCLQLVDTGNLLSLEQACTGDLKKKVDKLWKQSERAREVKANAVKNVLAKASQEASDKQTYHLKDKGVVTDDSQAMACKLVNHFRVPVANVDDVICTVAKPLGITADGTISKRTVSHVVLEGGVAAKLQLVQEFHNVNSVSFTILLRSLH